VAEDLLRLHLNGLRSEGITNGAIIILDNRSHEVLAMVGSGDFNDRAHDGQVNAVFAPRSPGSALKPFIYAQAIYLGLVSPAHYLEDVPTDFSGYAPENYDRNFSGMVSVRSALERSLNLPAVELENRLGDQDLYSILHRVGVSTIRSRKDYGLSIAIGGCEVNLFDLTALYSSFANNGIFIRPRQLKTEPETAGIRIFDAGTAYLITDILTGLRRPDLPTCWEFTSLPRVAWKTGTSYGHRDAWSIGYNPLYTAGVWLGNFSGQGAPNLIGAEVATPILFELMNYLNRNHPAPWFTQPDSVDVRSVCSLSGQLPSADCPTQMEELYLVERSPDRICECHQSVLVDDATGCRLPPDYPVSRKAHLQKFVQWPPRVGAWMESSGFEVKRLPPLLPGWQGLLPGQPPIIRSPSQDCEYRLREGIPAEFQKICCEASAGSEVQKLYWFIDGLLLGTVKPGERVFYTPTPGRHLVVCQDNLGRQSEFQLIVGNAE
jgi:penicillin-binding protein 1C